MTNTYNGWKNRQTWLVNVHFGDYFQGFLDEYYSDGSPPTGEWDFAYEFIHDLGKTIGIKDES